MEEDVPSRIRAAKEALEKQDFNSAGRHCKHVLKKDRNNDEAYVIFGKALMAQKQRGHAEMAFRKAIACNPAAFPAWQGLVELYEGTDDVAKLQEALEGAQKSAQATGDNNHLLLLEALETKLAGIRVANAAPQELKSSIEEDDKKLRQQIEQVVKLKSCSENEWRQAKLELLERCMLFITSGPSQLSFEVGLALSEEDDAGEMFLHFYPHNGCALAAAAFLHESTRYTSRTKAILDQLQEVLRMDSNSVIGWQAMAEIHLVQGAYVRAAECVNEGMKVVASWREAYGLSLVNAGLQLRLILAGASIQGNPASAEHIFQEVYQEAVTAHRGSISARALEGLAKISVAQGNLEEALSRLDSVVSIDPHSHWAIAEQGWISYSRGQFGEAVRCLEKAVALSPDVAIYHHRLGLAYVGASEALGYNKNMAVKQLMIAATLDPEQAVVFRDLGHQFKALPGASQKAISCYQKAVQLDANDKESGDALCDALEEKNQGSVVEATCKAATEKSPRAFWAWRRLGFLKVEEEDWAEAVVSLQHALRGYPQDAELWEALGLAYRQLGMLTAALKAYSGVLVLGSCSPLFSLLESGNILLSLSMFSKAMEMFRLAMQNCPTHVVALFGLASALLGRARECVGMGAFAWSSGLLEEAGQLAGQLTSVSGHLVAAWKLLGDVQATYSDVIPCEALDIQSPSYATGSRGQSEDTLLKGIESWHKMQLGAAKGARRAYQHALHLCPSDGSLYVDLGVSLDRVSSLEGSFATSTVLSPNPLDLVCGGIRLEGGSTDCWTALGALSSDKGLKQHALIQALRIDGDHSLAWALLGQLYLREGDEGLATQAFDRARSSNPLLSLPWAGMSFIHSSKGSKERLEAALADCLYAMHLSPTVDVQLGLAKLAAQTGQLHMLRVYLALEQVIQRAPHSPEAHNLRGLACESRSNFRAAIDAFHVARTLLNLRTAGRPEFSERYFAVSINLARVLCKAGKVTAAVREYERLAATGELMKDSAGMCGYAVSLWWDGRKDLAIATVHQAAESKGGKSKYESDLIIVLSKLLYFKLGPSAALRDMHQIAQLDYGQEILCFTLLALAVCSRQEQLLSELLPLCSAIFVGERASEGHVLLAAASQILHPENNKLVMLPLLKAVHLSPQDNTLRAKLAEVILESSAGQSAELCTRCYPPTLSMWETSSQLNGLKCLATAALACSSCRDKEQLPSLKSCHDFCRKPDVRTTLQRWLHKDPSNIVPHVYLLTEVLMQAKAMGYPANLCRAVLRMSHTALALMETQPKTKFNRQLQLHTLICASESALQNGDIADAVSFARSAAGQTPATSSFSGGFVQIARCYAATGDRSLVQNELRMLTTSLHPDDILGWIAVVVLQQRNGMRQDTNVTTANLAKAAQAMVPVHGQVWSAVTQVVRAQGFLDDGDLESAEKSAAQASAAWPSNSVLRLFHGAVALELAKERGGAEFWSSAARVLGKVTGGGQSSLPIAHALLVEAEAGAPSFRTSNTKYQKHVQTEWFNWPSDGRPAELYFRMGLLAKKSHGTSTGSTNGPETLRTAKSWMQHAAHLDPTASRYWQGFM